jgi:allantoin racemase
VTRILIVNSNTTDSVTARIGAAARAVAPPGATVEAISAPYGLPLIVTRADWLLAGPARLGQGRRPRTPGGFDPALTGLYAG